MAAWAAAQSIDPDEVDGYLDSMFPVILRRDTLVTSHRFDGTDAIAESAVLQRGTPVLVDDRGVPRLRCPGLQPLRPPADASSGGTYRGSAWFGFRAAGVVRVRPARAPLDGLRVVDPTTGEPFVRGRAGLVDRDA